MGDSKLNLPIGIDTDMGTGGSNAGSLGDSLLRRRHSTSITSNLIEGLPSKFQIPDTIRESAAISGGEGNSRQTSAGDEKKFSQFNSFLRRSSAAFMGDVSQARKGRVVESSIAEEPIEEGQVASLPVMTRNNGQSMFHKGTQLQKGQLLNTVNQNFTAATRSGLLSPPTFK